ncbi:MAG: glycosyltransferase family 4 protein [Thaumarchaeota archaeon]|nr:glycosyltransferase family 4 protein [Candidatus Calditenuaceae archaeon]MDW8043458.1 glycosyltransferase family 4 protein [Nitrososphaerota archaeon]
MTFTGKVSGLKAASLHAQYLEEYVSLAKFLDRITVVTDTVEFLPSDLPPNLEVLKVPRLPIPKLYGALKVFGYALPPLLGLRGTDVVYVRTFSPPELAALWLAGALRGLPTVLTIGGTWLFGKPHERPGPKKALFRWVLRRAAYTATKVTLYSKYMLPEVKYFLPQLDEGKVRIVHNSVRTDRFRPGLPPPEGWSDGVRRVFWVGRINEGKGVEDLIDAFAKVARRTRDVELWVAGTGERAFIQHLRRRAASLGVGGRVRFPGPIPNELVPRYMANAAVFPYPSRGGEGIPRAILEAMACGAPVVATRVSGIPEAVVHGETGLLVGRRDVEGLASAIEMILEDKSLAKRLASQARAKVEREFSHDVVIPQIASLLKEVCDEA